MSIEAKCDHRRGPTFSNLCADALLLYYLITMAGAVAKHERRTAARP